MIKILVAGQPQSGSTLIFNLILNAISATGQSVDSGWFENWEGSGDVILRKIHNYDEGAKKGADYVFTSCRDVRDCAVSHMKRQQSSGHGIGPWTPFFYGAWNIQTYKDWQKRSDLEIYYPNLVNNTLAVSGEIMSLMGYDAPQKEIVLEATGAISSSETPKNDSDDTATYAKTLLTKSHNTSGGASKKYVSFFDDETNRKMESCFKLFLNENDFETHYGETQEKLTNYWEMFAMSVVYRCYGFVEKARYYNELALEDFERHYDPYRQMMENARVIKSLET